MSSLIDAVDDELYRLDITISAAEDWSSTYDKDPESHIALIKAEAGLAKNLRKFFREQAERIHQFIDWSAYDMAVRNRVIEAANEFVVDVIVQDALIDESDSQFIKIVFEEISFAAAAGARSGENIYRHPIGADNRSSLIQRYARQHAASLVGKRIDENGNIINNPNADYRITDTTRNNIRESIRTSISLGENQTEAVERLRATIKNPKRAELIAQTEAVNSFQGGLLRYGNAAGAIMKESQSVGAVDRCADYDRLGAVDINFKYDGKYSSPAYHPRCRCGLRLIFPSELNANQK